MISRTRGGRLVGAIGLLLAAGIVAMVPAEQYYGLVKSGGTLPYC